MIFGKNKNELLDKKLKKILNHKKNVTNLINLIIIELHKRINEHDESSLNSNEVEVLTYFPEYIKKDSYLNEESLAYIREIKNALNIHFKKNSHHPEHFNNKIKDMNLIDIIEMLCDWKSTMSEDDDIISVIKRNKKIYNFSNELMYILINTSKIFNK